MTPIEKAVAATTNALLTTDNKRAVKYLSPTLVVSVCRRFKRKQRDISSDFVLKIGRPNYLEAKFVAAAEAAGEPFPIKRVQLQAWPVSRKK